MKVVRLTDDPSSSARQIGDLIASDVALTSRVLRIANSAYYGMSRSVSTVNEAVLILGMQALRSLAIAASAYDTLNREVAGYNMQAGELWLHSLSCGLASQIIAKRTRAARFEEAFVAGLMHDVGKVILNAHVQTQFQAILALVELEDMPFYQAEKMILGFDHAEVGARLAEKWNLPGALCAAIAGHHDLEQGEEAPQLTAIVHVANALCVRQGVSLVETGARKLLDLAALESLRLTEDALSDMVEEMMLQLDKMKSTLDLSRRAA
jgi:HD-like signal output (HDOD) protein